MGKSKEVKIFGKTFIPKELKKLRRTLVYDGREATDIDDVMVCGVIGYPCIRIGDITDKHMRLKQAMIAKKIFFGDN